MIYGPPSVATKQKNNHHNFPINVTTSMTPRDSSKTTEQLFPIAHLPQSLLLKIEVHEEYPLN